jgi:type I restriction enzyme R subunit
MPKKGKEKIDITIVVDMLLTGFDSKFLNTLYVDKNLKHHGLIQAFSRTNRVLNATKPYGNVLDFRGQQAAVDEAVAMFSGAHIGNPREIWLVEKAPKVIEKLDAAVKKLETFMNSQGVEFSPESVNNLKGTDARVGFIECFKEVQRLQTQLDQYTDLREADKSAIQEIISTEQLRGFRGAYIETADRIRTELGATGDKRPHTSVDQLDFEFVLFSSAMIDYDYIMALIARYSQQAPGKQKLSRDQLIGLIQSDSKFIDERDLISEYVHSLKVGEALSEQQIRDGYQGFKAEKEKLELEAIAVKHGLSAGSLNAFVENILGRMIFDAEQLTDLLAPLELGWKLRTKAELALMEDLYPLLTKRAGGREISGLNAYE